MFIVFEGIDGAGKDTQLFLAEQWLKKHSYLFQYRNKGKGEVIVESEPTQESEAGRKLHHLLTTGGIDTLDQKEILDLYVEDRLIHTYKIRRLLDEGKVVLSSRYDLSSYAYQTYRFSEGDLESFFFDIYRRHRYGDKDGCLIPDLTIFFTLPLEEALERIDKRGNTQHDFEKRDVLKKVRENYQKAITYLWTRDRRNIDVLDGSVSVEELSARVRGLLEVLFYSRPD